MPILEIADPEDSAVLNIEKDGDRVLLQIQDARTQKPYAYIFLSPQRIGILIHRLVALKSEIEGD